MSGRGEGDAKRICWSEAEILEEIGRVCREVSEYRIVRYGDKFYIRDEGFLMLSRGRMSSEKVGVEFRYNSGRLVFSVNLRRPLGERDVLFTATLIDATARLVHEDDGESGTPDIFAELEREWRVERKRKHTRIIAGPGHGNESGYYLFQGEVRTSKFLLQFRPHSRHEMLFRMSNRIEERYVRRIELFIWSMSMV